MASLLFSLLKNTIEIKAASSDEWALAVHAHRGMLLSSGLVHAMPSIEEVVPFIIWWLAPFGMK